MDPDFRESTADQQRELYLENIRCGIRASGGFGLSPAERPRFTLLIGEIVERGLPDSLCFRYTKF